MDNVQSCKDVGMIINVIMQSKILFRSEEKKENNICNMQPKKFALLKQSKTKNQRTYEVTKSNQ